MPVRLELRRMDQAPEGLLKFKAPPLDIRVRFPVVPPPGASDAGRAHGRLRSAELARKPNQFSMPQYDC
jgi:hypothetical protein